MRIPDSKAHQTCIQGVSPRKLYFIEQKKLAKQDLLFFAILFSFFLGSRFVWSFFSSKQNKNIQEINDRLVSEKKEMEKVSINELGKLHVTDIIRFYSQNRCEYEIAKFALMKSFSEIEAELILKKISKNKTEKE